MVIGFPCDQFAGQEPGSDEEIEAFCKSNYGVEFPLSTKVDVNGKETHPVFAFLKERAGGRLGSAIKWNFTKFLVAPDGTTIKRYGPTTKPEAIRADIESLTRLTTIAGAPEASRNGMSGTAAPVVKAMKEPTAAASGEPMERLVEPDLLEDEHPRRVLRILEDGVHEPVGLVGARSPRSV